jgi:hypothetical protein
MRWSRWIFAYLFDCVHPHTTWPRRNHAGFAYVCCLDCGRELPYSLESMRIVTRKQLLQGQRGLRVLGPKCSITEPVVFRTPGRRWIVSWF